MIAVWESDISATFLIFRLKCSTDAAFFKLWTSYSITWPRCKRSFVSDNWCLVWTGSALPQSFLSCKQSDAERTDFVHTAEEGHSWFYTSLRPHDPSKGARAREILRRCPHVSHDITLSLLILAKRQSNKKINFHFAKCWQINNNVQNFCHKGFLSMVTLEDFIHFELEWYTCIIVTKV